MKVKWRNLEFFFDKNNLEGLKTLENSAFRGKRFRNVKHSIGKGSITFYKYFYITIEEVT